MWECCRSIRFLWVCVCDSAMVSLHISERKMEHKKTAVAGISMAVRDNFRSIYESDIDEISYWIIVKREFALGCKLSFFGLRKPRDSRVVPWKL